MCILYNVFYRAYYLATILSAEATILYLRGYLNNYFWVFVLLGTLKEIPSLWKTITKSDLILVRTKKHYFHLLVFQNTFLSVNQPLHRLHQNNLGENPAFYIQQQPLKWLSAEFHLKVIWQIKHRNMYLQFSRLVYIYLILIEKDYFLPKKKQRTAKILVQRK